MSSLLSPETSNYAPTADRSAQIRQTNERLAKLEKMYEELSILEAKAAQEGGLNIGGLAQPGIQALRSPGSNMP